MNGREIEIGENLLALGLSIVSLIGSLVSLVVAVRRRNNKEPHSTQHARQRQE